MDETEMFARLQYLYICVSTMALGDYSKEAEMMVAEYFELRELIYGF